MYLSVSSNDPGMKSKTYGVMWHVAPKVSVVKLLGAVHGTISIKIHLKGAFGLSGILDLAFFFSEEI